MPKNQNKKTLDPALRTARDDTETKKIRGVLFDFDGTLFDTAPELAKTLNELRKKYSLPPLPFEEIRPCAGHGSKSMLKLAFNIDHTHQTFPDFFAQFLELYRHNHLQTELFSGIEAVIDYLASHHLPWGIVTNRPTSLTTELLKAKPFKQPPACIVCGDTLSKNKPDPDTILHACQILKLAPEECLYVGDTETDVIASKAAGTHSLIVLYGYAAKHETPHDWQADAYVDKPDEIIHWLEKMNVLA